MAEKSSEKIYQAEEGPKTREEFIVDKIAEIEGKYGKPIAEVIKERGETLGIIAKMVGKNFDMDVNFGEIGGGSYFISEDKSIPKEKWNSITLDPLILAEFEGADEFVSAHEGAHRAITRTLEQSGLKTRDEREKQAKQIGLMAIRNIGLEDPAVNNWSGHLYPRIKTLSDKNYEKSFEQENVVMTIPVVTQLIQMLGYVPDFVKYASELERYWHKKSFSKDLPADVAEALKITRLAAEKYWQEIPYIHPTEKDVLNKARIRWQIYEKGIWPFAEKLIEKDIIDENLKQYLKDQLKKAMEKMKQGPQEEQEKQQGGEPQFGERDGEQSLEVLMEQFGFDEKEKQELREKMKEAAKRQKEHREKLKEKIMNDEISKEEFDEKMRESQDNLPLDMKSLSDSTKKKIQDKLSEEPKETQEQIDKNAKESLEKAEDEVNKNSQGKIGPKEESHRERKKRQEKEIREAEERARKIAEELAEKQKQETEFEKWQKEQEAKRTEWEKAVTEQAKTIDELHQLIEELFQKKKHPRWKRGFSAGQRLDLGAAMQFEADPRNYTRLWEKKTIPEKYDYRFTLLNDQSGSMRDGKKAENDLIAKAMTTEVLTALGIPCEILGYTTPSDGKYSKYIETYKGFDEDLNEMREKLQPKLSKIISEGGGLTPTYTATQIASEKLALQKEGTKNNAHFLIVISDGEPYGDPQDSSIEGLRELNMSLSGKNNQVIIGMGIGDGIKEENLKIAYGDGRYVYAKNPEEFPQKMAALLEAIFTQSQIKH